MNRFESQGPVFETSGPVRLRVDNQAGRVEVLAHDRPVTEVDITALVPEAQDLVDGTRIEAHQVAEILEVTIHVPSPEGRPARCSAVAVVVRTPEGVNLGVTTASADVEVRGRCDQVEVRTASGEVRVDEVAGDARLRTASGDMRLGSVGGRLRAQSASGDQRIERLGGEAEVEAASGDVWIDRADASLEVRAASGDVHVGRARADLTIKTASGDQRVGSVRQGAVGLQAASGDLVIGIARGSLLTVEAHSLTGDTTSEIDLSDDPDDDRAGEEAGPLVELRAKTVSGDIRILRAADRDGGAS